MAQKERDHAANVEKIEAAHAAAIAAEKAEQDRLQKQIWDLQATLETEQADHAKTTGKLREVEGMI